jgi:hypothetical protein
MKRSMLCRSAMGHRLPTLIAEECVQMMQGRISRSREGFSNEDPVSASLSWEHCLHACPWPVRYQDH